MKVKLQTENRKAAEAVVEYLKTKEYNGLGGATVYECQCVMWDNKPHINGSKRKWPIYMHGSLPERGRGLSQNYQNIWKHLLYKGLVTIEPHPKDQRAKLVKVRHRQFEI